MAYLLLQHQPTAHYRPAETPLYLQSKELKVFGHTLVNTDLLDVVNHVANFTFVALCAARAKMKNPIQKAVLYTVIGTSFETVKERLFSQIANWVDTNHPDWLEGQADERRIPAEDRVSAHVRMGYSLAAERLVFTRLPIEKAGISHTQYEDLLLKSTPLFQLIDWSIISNGLFHFIGRITKIVASQALVSIVTTIGDITHQVFMFTKFNSIDAPLMRRLEITSLLGKPKSADNCMGLIGISDRVGQYLPLNEEGDWALEVTHEDGERALYVYHTTQRSDPTSRSEVLTLSFQDEVKAVVQKIIIPSGSTGDLRVEGATPVGQTIIRMGSNTWTFQREVQTD